MKLVYRNVWSRARLVLTAKDDITADVLRERMERLPSWRLAAVGDEGKLEGELDAHDLY